MTHAARGASCWQDGPSVNTGGWSARMTGPLRQQHRGGLLVFALRPRKPTADLERVMTREANHAVARVAHAPLVTAPAPVGASSGRSFPTRSSESKLDWSDRRP
ncbi:hypothetical protein PHYPSEUDO_006934 [Phytophthora pseudosyringae]|uniref:Uncharacterized protein n=1 Tax=Phytophthora pseudosyringae TaxID=221518 RepID=A0A8T1VKD1_9STRA|nr:hypothetical protein PHYPSEUDO_006934 [Phytophthora pseudosyringae]